MSRKKLIKSTGIIGSATSASRVLGFVRDILFARLFGTNMYAQAFVVAFRIPNMLRDMVGEGATDAAIVPILTEYWHTRSKEDYWEVARIMFNLMLTVLLLLTAAGVLFSPVIVRIIAPGFLRTPEKFEMTVTLTRIVFPYILFLGLVAFSKGVLNSLNYFTTPALAPVVLNISLIVSFFVLCPVLGVKGLIAGVLIGGALELAIQVRPLRKFGFGLQGGFRLVHPIVKRITTLLIPRAIGSAVYQLSVLVDTVLASLGWIVGAGGVAALYYSGRLVHLPLAVFGISLATAALPKMTKELASDDMTAFKDTISFSLRTVFSVMIPAAVGLMILSGPMVRILFQRGEFSAYSTQITSTALSYYAIGLFAYAGIKILVSACYSMGDTRTPVKTAAISLMINLVLNLMLMWHLKIGGLALATSVAAISNFIMLYTVIRKRIGSLGTKIIAFSLVKILASSLIMGAFTFSGAYYLSSIRPGSTLVSALALAVLVGLSGLIYCVFAILFKVDGIKKIYCMALRKVRRV